MIKIEELQNGKFIRRFSDLENKELLQVDTGIRYKEAIDINPTQHLYQEVEKEKKPKDDYDEDRISLKELTMAYSEGVESI